MKFDSYDMHMLSHNIEWAKEPSPLLDAQIDHLFGRATIEPWTSNFDAAAALFKAEFPTWSRNCLYNSCQGIWWYLNDEAGDEQYGAVSETDAIALCAAMVKAKRKEQNL